MRIRKEELTCLTIKIKSYSHILFSKRIKITNICYTIIKIW